MVEVCVVVQDRQRRGLGDGSDEEIRNLAPFQTVAGQRALDLQRTFEVVRFDVDPTERSQRDDETIPFVGVACRETDLAL